MQRDSILIIFIISVIAVVLVSSHGHPLESKKTKHLCNSIDVRNDLTELNILENCTIITGNLMISHIYPQDENAFLNYSFPNLREIHGFLLIYEVHHLKSVGKLLPSLTIVRGFELIYNHALVLYQVLHLQEIGLTNLMHVGRGQVMVGRCQNVCYVETIDWTQIGVVDHLTKEVVANCPKTCPLHCTHCWNEFHCQKKSDGCHEECFGCTKPNSAAHCLSCKNFEEDSVCVRECSADKYTHLNANLCLSREECLSILNNTQFIYQNHCIESCPLDTESGKDRECTYCGNNCMRSCIPPPEVNSVQDLDLLHKCTIIEGSLKIHITDSFTHEFLHHGFSRIREIYGDLIIYRSDLRSLEVFANLQIIHGDKNQTNPKALFVYENPQLRQLWNFTKNFKILKGYVQFYNNPSLCYPEIKRMAAHTNTTDGELLKLMERFNGNGFACNDRKQITLTKQLINSTNITLEWEPYFELPRDENTFYSIYYMKSDGKKNLTYFEGEDHCNQKWNSTFVQTTDIFIKYLEPYTDYAYFFKMHTGLTVMRTVMYYFKTAPDDPSSVENLSASALSDTSIKITWSPPASLNGNFSYYAITMLLEEDYLPTIEAINFCSKKPIRDEPILIKPKEIIENIPRGNDDECMCESNKTTTVSDNVKDTFTAFDFNQVCRKDCSKYMYSNDIPFPDSHILVPRDAPPDYMQKDFKNTSYQIYNLRPFTTYIFFLRACNKNLNGSKELCSGVEMTSTRTKRRATSDHVKSVKVTLIDEKNVKVDWSKPSETNSELLAYVIELDRKDSKHFTIVEECISKKPYTSMPQSHVLRNLSPGMYAVRVKAVSLAGPGEPSDWENFELHTSLSENSLIGILVALLFVALITIATAIGYYRYKKRHALDGVRLIASINPDYAGPIYVEDEWEINHNDVEIHREIGKGSFGLVYEGLMKSRSDSRYIKCAIKTVSDTATITSRMEFLNEGSVMKSFNTAPHVVRLLGIVSRGPTPLVIMELMERGDLKSYLRLCREPSKNLTTNEMYRMAAEIADGMAYLAAKKFVHRDLATRNCMVGADYTVKIGDFGMARDIYETDYYRKDTVGFLPVRWMAPESLADGVFTSDSDVWSYGVVLWEMATLAELPYQGLANEQVLTFVKQRGKLSRPPECSEVLFEVMDACWHWHPNERPTFRAIVDKLSNHVGEAFRVVAFCFSQEGIDSARTAGARVYNPPAMSAMLRNDDRMYGQFDTSEEDYDDDDEYDEENRPTFPSS